MIDITYGSFERKGMTVNIDKTKLRVVEINDCMTFEILKPIKGDSEKHLKIIQNIKAHTGNILRNKSVICKCNNLPDENNIRLAFFFRTSFLKNLNE